MKYVKNQGILFLPKTWITVGIIGLSLGLFSCATNRPAVDSWADASLVAEQRLEIERQRKYIADLERIIQSGSENLRAAAGYLGELEQGNYDFADWLRRVDQFVRAVIDEQRKLEAVQQSDSGTDAGTR